MLWQLVDVKQAVQAGANGDQRLRRFSYGAVRFHSTCRIRGPDCSDHWLSQAVKAADSGNERAADLGCVLRKEAGYRYS